MAIYAEVNTNNQIIDTSSNPVCPLGYTEMSGQRPDIHYIATVSGEWIEDAEAWVNQALEERDNLLVVAAVKIAPLQDAVDIDEATDEEEAKLKEWKKYRVILNRIEQQAGFPREIDWPIMPE